MTHEPAQSQSSKEQNWEDRRSTPRHKTDIEVTWRLMSEKPQEIRKGQLVDLSISGAAIVIDEALVLDAYISIKLPPAKQKPNETSSRPSTSFSIKGKIVNSRQLESGSWRYGIKFERLYYTLAQWVNQAG